MYFMYDIEQACSAIGEEFIEEEKGSRAVQEALIRRECMRGFGRYLNWKVESGGILVTILYSTDIGVCRRKVM